jgi:lipopolysaccharide biosynthesis glycosyltransferase
MKRIIYQVYLGKRSKLYDHCTASVKAYAKRIGADYEVQRTPILMIKPDVFMTNRSKESYEKHGVFLPIYEKENAFAYLREYDQVAIIDADCYIRSDSPSIFDELPSEYSFGGVLEKDMPITPQYKNKIVNYSRMQYGMAPINRLFEWDDRGANFYNMGIMVLNKSFNDYLDGETPLQFLRRPRFKPFIDGLGAWKWSTDQTLLNVFVKESGMKVKNLDWKFNALYKGVRDDHIKKAHFIHFFLKDKLPARGENVQELMMNV